MQQVSRPNFVFGKGRTHGRRGKLARAKFRKRTEVWLAWDGRRVVKPSYISWNSESTTLRQIQKNLEFNLAKLVSSKARGGRRPLIVDWGCGKGVAVTRLVRKFPNIRAYGFSDKGYNEWLANGKVKFIFSKHPLFRRYFKKGTVDLLYSNKGILHLRGSVPDYIKEILPVLKVGGVLVTDVVYESFGPHGKSVIKAEGMQFEAECRPWYYKSGRVNIWHHDVIVAKRIK